MKMVFDLIVSALHIITSLVGLMMYFAVCFCVGITYFYAIQHYGDLHDFQKTDLKENNSTAAIQIQRRIYNDTNDLTEKPSNFTVNNRLSAFNVGTTSSSAIQRYRNLHEFRKTTQNDQTPRDISTHRTVYNNTNYVTEKTPNIIKSSIDTEKQIAIKDKTMTPSSLLSFIRVAGEKAYLTEISINTKMVWNLILIFWVSQNSSSSTISDDYDSTTNSTTASRTNSAVPTSKNDRPTPILRTTTKIPSSTSTNKKLSAPIFGCKATCGSCADITSRSGVIMSPNYPEHYYSPTDIGYVYCLYTINVPEGKRIHLVFQELNLVFSDWGDFLEVIDKSHDNYEKILATFNAGDEAVAITTKGESMSIFFEGNPGGFTKNGKAPAWKATYYAI